MSTKNQPNNEQKDNQHDTEYIDIVGNYLDESLDYETDIETEEGYKYLVIKSQTDIMQEAVSIGNELDSRAVSNFKGSPEYKILLN